MKTFLLLGYTGRKVSDLQAFAEGADAAIVDIRYSPRSRNPEYDLNSLQRRFGERYFHFQEWGNRNFKGGPMEIVDFELGLSKIKSLSNDRIILMCACPDASTCHRTVVGSMLSEHGFEVYELASSSLQLPLC